MTLFVNAKICVLHFHLLKVRITKKKKKDDSIELDVNRTVRKSNCMTIPLCLGVLHAALCPLKYYCPTNAEFCCNYLNYPGICSPLYSFADVVYSVVESLCTVNCVHSVSFNRAL